MSTFLTPDNTVIGGDQGLPGQITIGHLTGLTSSSSVVLVIGEAGDGGNGGTPGGFDGDAGDDDGFIAIFPGIESSGHRRFTANRTITWPGITTDCMAVLHASSSQVIHKRNGVTRETYSGAGVMEITDLAEGDTLEIFAGVTHIVTWLPGWRYDS